jgi:cytidine deaminase
MTYCLDTMILKAREILKHAYAPYSKFSVGACISSNQHYFVGANVENASYSLTLCAESAAIASMIANGNTKIDSIVIIADTVDYCPPCGACRQRIAEFADKHCQIHLVDKNSNVKSYGVTDLLPLSFSSNTLKRE